MFELKCIEIIVMWFDEDWKKIFYINIGIRRCFLKGKKVIFKGRKNLIFKLLRMLFYLWFFMIF